MTEVMSSVMPDPVHRGRDAGEHDLQTTRYHSPRNNQHHDHDHPRREEIHIDGDQPYDSSNVFEEDNEYGEDDVASDGEEHVEYLPLGTSERMHSEAMLREQRRLTRKAQLEEEELSTCTFSPQINHPRRGQRYHEDAWQRLARYDRLVLPEGAAYDMEQLQHCTFRPRINETSRAMAAFHPSNTRLSPTTPMRVGGSGNRACPPTAVKMTSDDIEELEHCTFKPKINERPRSPYVPIKDRVRDILRTKQERVFVRALEEDGKCTFAPQINPHSDTLAREKEMRESFTVVRHPSGDAIDPQNPIVRFSTPRPKAASDNGVDEMECYSSSSLGAPGTTPRVKQYDDAIRTKYEHDVRAHILRTQEVMKTCTFRPSIDVSSRRLTQKNPLFQPPFERRQEIYAARRSQHMHQLTQEHEEREMTGGSGPDTVSKRQAATTKYPKRQIVRGLNNSTVSSITTDTNHRKDKSVRRRLDPHLVWEQIQRLHSAAPERTKAVREELRRAAHAEECPFRPHISERSREMAAGRGRDGYMMENASAASRRRPSKLDDDKTNANEGGEKNNNEAADEEDGAASVKSAPQRRSRSSTEFYEQQLRHQQLHDERVEELQRAKAIQELSHCTFTPRITDMAAMVSGNAATTTTTIKNGSSRVRSASVDAVKGVGEYMARQQRAQQQRHELENRRELIGRGKPCNGPNYTLVRPFELQTSQLPRSRSWVARAHAKKNSTDVKKSAAVTTRKSMYARRDAEGGDEDVDASISCRSSSPAGVAMLVRQLVGGTKKPFY
eukprot:PhM_4_TR6478/c0_g1_i1/m.58141